MAAGKRTSEPERQKARDGDSHRTLNVEPNARDQQIAATGFSISQDVIAILLHRLVRRAYL